MGIRCVASMILLSFAVLSCKREQATEPGVDERIVASFSSQDNRLLVGACYYPWYRKGAHWGGDNLRYNLDPPQPPQLGKYDCMDQAVITQHVQWSAQAGVDFWISSWWGPGEATDDVILNGHLQNPEFLKRLGYCVLYEPTQGKPIIVNDSYISKFVSDLTYLIRNHFKSSNYLKIDNKPVLYIYLTRTMQGNYQGLFASADSLLQSSGYNGLYVVGDEAYWRQFSEARLQYIEAVTAYNPHISESWVTNASSFITRCNSEVYVPWMDIVNKAQKSFWVCVIPGFNDLGVRPAEYHPVIPRGSAATFSEFLRSVKAVLKRQTLPLKFLVVTSWNEWHEDTQIEPTVVLSEPTQKPADLTRGNWYYGYGAQYLDTLAVFKREFNN